MENKSFGVKTFYPLFSRLALLNLAIVAAIGVIMRYKIGFDFPFFDQKNLQHAHSHFAFGGWVTLVLYLFITNYAEETGVNISAYKKLIRLQLLSSVGMLVAFAMGGYNIISISLSSATVLISYGFLYLFIRDKEQMNARGTAQNWYFWGLLFQALSSLGTFSLAYMMATHRFDQHTYLASVYFFLHFQYNGWFLFGIIGSALHFFYRQFKIEIQDKRAYQLLCISVVPAYGLSVLWMDLAWPIYSIVVLFVILQSIGIADLLIKFWQLRSFVLPGISTCIKWGSIFAGTAYGIKFLLQLVSVIPALSQLAFGFRPVVIAYLHLVLLAATSVTLLTLLMGNGWIKSGRAASIGFILLLIGIFLNEAGLGIQGMASFDYNLIPGINPYLFMVSCLILAAISLLLIGQYPTNKNKDHILN